MIELKPMDKDTLQHGSGQAKLYEVAYLISPDYSEEEAEAFQQSLKNEAKSLGGIIDDEGGVLKRRLFYPIKKMSEAHLASFRFLLASEKISEFKEKFLAPEVLRFLIVNTKRQPPRTIRPMRIGKIIPEKPILEHKIKSAPQILEAKQPAEDAAANIEEIDKKLEEILGK